MNLTSIITMELKFEKKKKKTAHTKEGQMSGKSIH